MNGPPKARREPLSPLILGGDRRPSKTTLVLCPSRLPTRRGTIPHSLPRISRGCLPRGLSLTPRPSRGTYFPTDPIPTSDRPGTVLSCSPSVRHISRITDVSGVPRLPYTARDPSCTDSHADLTRRPYPSGSRSTCYLFNVPLNDYPSGRVVAEVTRTRNRQGTCSYITRLEQTPVPHQPPRP